MSVIFGCDWRGNGQINFGDTQDCDYNTNIKFSSQSPKLPNVAANHQLLEKTSKREGENTEE